MKGFDSLRIKKILHLLPHSEINTILDRGIRDRLGV